MLGRGIDQILPHSVDSRLYEPYVKSATTYVEMAEAARGHIAKPVDFFYVWGIALEEFERRSPDVKIVNLEAAVTTSEDYWKGKDVHYRVHPENVPVLTAAGIDLCSLANNHVLDWGYSGLAQTLDTLKKAKVKTGGAGRNLEEARAPALFEVPGKGRVVVFSYGSTTSGIPPAWAASEKRPGVNLLTDFSEKAVQDIRNHVQEVKQEGDVVVFSVHWGSNWGYQILWDQQAFARRLIDGAGIDLVHGHSSHHVQGIEVYRDRLILYGCGDFLTDYEGIAGYEHFRGDLGLMYFAEVDPATGKLAALEMIPTQVRNFRVNRASRADALWLLDVLNREGRRLGTRVRLSAQDILTLEWDASPPGN